MPKGEPDDEFAQIGLSFFNSQGKEIVIYCPESKDATATQQPLRRQLNDKLSPERVPETEIKEDSPILAHPTLVEPPSKVVTTSLLPKELMDRHFTIMYGDIGHSYESIIGPYLSGAKTIFIEDPYIRLQHQIQNFVRFCETILKAETVKKLALLPVMTTKHS